MIVIIWKIIITAIVLVMAIIGAFLGWRVLRLMERVKLLQLDRNELLEERSKQSNKLRLKGIEMEEAKKKMCSDILFRTITDGEKFVGELLSEIEKKMILTALNMPEYGKAMEDSKTQHQVRKAYKELIKKIKDSFE